MKFANLALFGAASANFLQLQELTTVDYQTTAPWKLYYPPTNKVGEMLCQPHEGYIFWDLKPLDGHGVDYIGKDAGSFAGHTFAVEVCENSFPTSKLTPYTPTSGRETFELSHTNANLKQGNAYWTQTNNEPVGDDSSTFTPVFSFLSASFESKPGPEEDQYTGWKLTYASQENCGTTEDPKPFLFYIHGVCDEKNTAGTYSDYTHSDSCSASVTYTGKAGCVAFNGNAVWDAIKPFTGVILILVGGLMTFAGAKFLFQLLSAFVTLVATILFYLIISNIFFGVKTQAGWKIGLIIVAIGVGLGAAYISYKLTSKFAIPIIAGGAGGFGFKLISNVAGIRNEYAAIGILFLGILAGVYLGYKLNEFVKTFGTAFLGSYILIRGAGFFFGGFPEGVQDIKVHEIKGHDKIVWYFVAFIIFFAAGSFTQWKLFHHDEDLKAAHDDVFHGEDDDGEKKCGCF